MPYWVWVGSVGACTDKVIEALLGRRVIWSLYQDRGETKVVGALLGRRRDIGRLNQDNGKTKLLTG